MAGNDKNAVSKAQNELHRRVLQQLLKQDDNRSGVHRSLGVDVSKVRSTTLDTWLPEQVSFIQSMGNRKANLYWEGKLPRDFRRPSEGDMSQLRYFINEKYRDRSYALRTWDKPPTIETYLVHPFMKQFEEGASSPQDSEEAPQQTADAGPSQGRPSARSKVVDIGNLKLSEPVKAPQDQQQRRKPPLNPSSSAKKQTVVSPQLFDLLSLDEPESAPSPSVEDALFGGPSSSQNTAAAPSQGAENGGWAAFEAESATPPPQTATGIESLEDTWDAFQTSSPLGQSSGSPGDPFHTQGSAELSGLHEAEFKPVFPPTSLPSRHSAPSQPEQSRPASRDSAPAKPASMHRSQRSMDEIMAMFDGPSATGSDIFSGLSQAPRPATQGPNSAGHSFGARPPQPVSEELFQPDWSQMSDGQTVHVASGLHDIQLPADFWSPNFKAPQQAPMTTQPGKAVAPHHHHSQSEPNLLSDDDWAAFGQR